MDQAGYDRLFPEQAKLREKAQNEREKLGITIEQVAWITRKLKEHMHDPGTFRYLIYTELGFPQESDAYAVLMEAGLMEIHNHLVDWKQE
jgi:hypothetical protein